MDDMNFDNLDGDMMEELNRLMGMVMVEQLKELPALLTGKFSSFAELFTDEYITRLAVAVHMLAIGFPYVLLRLMGIEKTAMQAIAQAPEKFNLAAFTETLQTGFRQMSPAFAQAITSDVVELASKLLLLDLLTSPFPDQEELQYDTHFYMQMARQQLGKDVDREAVERDTFQMLQTITPEEIITMNIPSELIERLRSKFGQQNSPYED